MKIDATKAIGFVDKIACLDFTKAKLPWTAVNKTNSSGETYTVINDNEGKTVCIFTDSPDSSSGDFSADDLCNLVNMTAKIRKEFGYDA